MQGVINVSSSQRLEMIDINKEVGDIVKKSDIKEGLCNVYVAHATAAIAMLNFFISLPPFIIGFNPPHLGVVKARSKRLFGAVDILILFILCYIYT